MLLSLTLAVAGCATPSVPPLPSPPPPSPSAPSAAPIEAEAAVPPSPRPTKPAAEERKEAREAFAQAEELFKEGRFPEAIEAYRRIADLYPQTLEGPKSLFRVGYLYLLNPAWPTSNRGKARQALHSLLERYPTLPQRPWAEALIRLIDQLEEGEKKALNVQQAQEALVQDLARSKAEQERLFQEREALKREMEGLQQRLEKIKGENADLRAELKRLKELDILLEKKNQP